jgi:trehalose 6-phosphate synthase/phosphatase
MSTTSLEYVVCQQNVHGPIIISEFSGTASNLEEAVHINPWDTVGVANQIYEALTMSEEERQTMHAALYRRITEKDVGHWVTTVLRRLRRVVGQRGKQPVVQGLPIISEK